MLIQGTVVVRRVVEARRLAANGGTESMPTRTAALPPMTEKDNMSSSAPPDKHNDGPSKWSFWKRLKCW